MKRWMWVFVGFVLPLTARAGDDGLATDKDYKIVLDGTTSRVKAGGTGTFTLQIVGQNGFAVKAGTPVSIAVTPPSGLKFASTKFTRKDMVDPDAKDPQLKTSFQATDKGAQTLHSEVSFFLCTEKLCQRMTANRDQVITVE